jgi:hypothetical protein
MAFDHNATAASLHDPDGATSSSASTEAAPAASRLGALRPTPIPASPGPGHSNAAADSQLAGIGVAVFAGFLLLPATLLMLASAALTAAAPTGLARVNDGCETVLYAIHLATAALALAASITYLRGREASRPRRRTSAPGTG